VISGQLSVLSGRLLAKMVLAKMARFAVGFVRFRGLKWPILSLIHGFYVYQ
jgi:hypothetical protein